MPASPSELTPAWLEDVLRRGGVPATRVRTVDAVDIGAGFGFDASTVRVSIDGDGVPATLVAKWCNATNAVREERFYREIAPRVGGDLARCIACATDPASGRAVLLLTDVAHAAQGDVLVGATREQADAVVDAMAAVHAAFWNRPDDPAIAWLPRWGPGRDERTQRTAAAVHPFLEMWGDRISPAARDAVRALPERMPLAYTALDAAPATVVHADLHLDNVLFRAEGSAVLLDWTEAARGAAALDFAWFLVLGVRPADRARGAPPLAESYADAIAALGVRGYGADALLRDTVHAATLLLAAEVRATVRTDVVRPSHPRVRPVIDFGIAQSAEFAGETRAWRLRA